MDYGLKPCPFCGGTKLKIDKKSSFRYYGGVRYCTYSVRCNICHARGGTVSGNVLKDNSTIAINISESCVIEEDLIKHAVDNWNMRCDNETVRFMA